MSPDHKKGADVLRVVFDTNVLIDSTNDSLNAASRLLDAAIDGKAVALATNATKREYQTIIQRLVNTPSDQEHVQEFIDHLEMVSPVHVDVTLDDEEDYKFLQAAIGGKADVLVTRDRHLLDVGELDDMRVIQPDEAVNLLEETSDGNGQWQSWVQGLGIG